MPKVDPNKLNSAEKELVKAVLLAEHERIKASPLDAHKTAVKYYRAHVVKMLKKLGERYIY